MTATLTLGSLCTGYGGLDLAAEQLLGTRTVWTAEFDDAPARIVAHRFPDAPNLRDITAIDWHSIERVDVITAGYPCQPFSLAGGRKGTSDERHLWPDIMQGIRVMRPRHVLLENVRGHLSLGFDEVLWDLAHAGYAVTWRIVAASDIGACHRRERLFIHAQPAEYAEPAFRNPLAVINPDDRAMPGAKWLDAETDLFGDRAPWRWQPPTAGRMAAGMLFEWAPQPLAPRRTLLPTPLTTDSAAAGSADAHRNSEPLRSLAARRFPTPDYAAGTRGGAQDPARRRAGGHAVTLDDVVSHLPTPAASDGTGGRIAKDPTGMRESGVKRAVTLPTIAHHYLADTETLPTPRATRGGSATEISYALGAEWDDEHRPQGIVQITGAGWGPYAAAVALHAETVTGTVPPPPTQPNTKGNPQLAPAFVEWMMGLPAGWVTDIGLTRAQELKALGNGVVPQQACAAYRSMGVGA